MQPDVSFVVAAYNASGTIERSIASALASEGVVVEVVVADDASTDDTAAIVERLRDPRIRLVRLERNGGPGAARNAALAAARGRVVAVLDADDEVRPERMMRLVQHMEAGNADAAVDNIVYGGEAGLESKAMFPADVFQRMGTLTLERYVLGNCLFAGGYNLGYLKPVFRLDFLRQHGLVYPASIRIGEDFLFLASVLAANAVCVLREEVGYIYHITKGSISRVLCLDHVEQMIASDDEFLAGRSFSKVQQAAWRARRRSLDEGAAFLSAVEAVKHRKVLALLQHVFREPLAMRHFQMPIAIRLKRVLGAFRPRERLTSSSLPHSLPPR